MMDNVWLVISLSSNEEMMSIEVYADEQTARNAMQDRANSLPSTVTHEWGKTWNGDACITMQAGAIYVGEMQLRPAHVIKAGE